MKPQFCALSLLLSLLYACADPKDITITYNAQFCDEHIVKLDDTLILRSTNEDAFDTLRIKSGSHTLIVNGGKAQHFNIEDDGILNIAHDEFVIFPIKYIYGDEGVYQSNLGVPNRIRIDSFIVGSKTHINHLNTPPTKLDLQNIDNGDEMSALYKIDSNQLVIKKIWELGITDEIPSSMTKGVPRDARSSVAYKKKVMEASQFLRFAAITGDYNITAISAITK